MSKKLILASVSLVIGILAILIWFSLKEKTQENVIQENFSKTKSKNDKRESVAQNFSNLLKSSSNETEVQLKIFREALQMGQIDLNPVATQERLNELAKNLSINDFSIMTSMALNSKLNGDERFMSVYLMSLSQNSHKTESLVNIAKASIPSDIQDPRLYDQEVIIRLQAIESIAQLSDTRKARSLLQKILMRQNNINLLYAARSYMSTMGR